MSSEEVVHRFISTFVRPDLGLDESLLNMSLRNVEFEARLCTPVPTGSRQVNTNIQKAQWDRMMSALNALNKGNVQYSELVYERYGKENNNITSLRPSTGGEEPAEFRYKRKLGTMDLEALGSAFNLRLAASLELPVRTPPSSDDVTERFIKRRWSFSSGDTMRVDLTQLSCLTAPQAKDIFQAELEVIDVDGAMRAGCTAQIIWAQIKALVAILAEACDMRICNNIRYKYIQQRLY